MSTQILGFFKKFCSLLYFSSPIDGIGYIRAARSSPTLLINSTILKVRVLTAIKIGSIF